MVFLDYYKVLISSIGGVIITSLGLTFRVSASKNNIQF